MTFGFIVAALFFFQFLRETRDELFASFAAAFALFAINQSIPVVFSVASEDQSPIYLIEFAGYVMIIVGILRKKCCSNRLTRSIGVRCRRN